GAIWFALVSVLAILAISAREAIGRSIWGYLCCLSVPAVFVACVLAFISFAILGTACVVCVATYAAVAGVAVGSFAADRLSPAQAIRQFVRDVRKLPSSPLGLAILFVFVIGTWAAASMFANEQAAASADSALPL